MDRRIAPEVRVRSEKLKAKSHLFYLVLIVAFIFLPESEIFVTWILLSAPLYHLL
jgi:hypothetical protein